MATQDPWYPNWRSTGAMNVELGQQLLVDGCLINVEDYVEPGLTISIMNIDAIVMIVTSDWK